MLQFSSSQFSNLRWRYFVESLLLKSTPNVSSVVLSSARVAGVDRADARASSVAREPPGGFLHRGGVSRLVASRRRRVGDCYRREIRNCLPRFVAPRKSR